MNELRCQKCNRKLGEGDIVEGMIEIMCPRCNTKNQYKTKSLQKASSDS